MYSVGRLAVCAVRIELCSGLNSLINRESAGNFREKRPESTDSRAVRSGNRSCFSRIPYSAEQGIFRRLQGIFGDQQRIVRIVFAFRVAERTELKSNIL